VRAHAERGHEDALARLSITSDIHGAFFLAKPAAVPSNNGITPPLATF